jgi:hypothetical protein
MEQSIDFSQLLRKVFRVIPEHRCAYCGSLETQVKSIRDDLSSVNLLCLSIHCRSCGKEDLPSIPQAALKSILMHM